MKRSSMFLSALFLAAGLNAATTGIVSSTERERWRIPEDSCGQFMKIFFDKDTMLLVGDNPAPRGGGRFSIESGELLCVGALKDGAYQELVSGGGWGGHPYEIEIRHDKALVVEERLPDVRAYHELPYAQTTVACDVAGCHVTDSHCALALPANPYPDIVHEVQTLSKMDALKLRSGNPSDVEYFVNPLLIRALWGDPDAEKLLFAPPTDLDGVPAEVWGGAIDEYRRAKQINCAPLPQRAHVP